MCSSAAVAACALRCAHRVGWVWVLLLSVGPPSPAVVEPAVCEQCAGFWRHVYAQDSNYTIHLDFSLMIEGGGASTAAAHSRLRPD